MAQKYPLIVHAEGASEPFEVELSAANPRDAARKVEEMCSTTGVWRSIEGAEVFIPARRIREVWLHLSDQQ